MFDVNRFITLVLVVLTMATFAFAQNGKAPFECPTISVTGPSGSPSITEPMPFKAIVKSHDGPREFRYSWIVTGGKIVSGHDTEKVYVSFLAPASITATVNVSGGPADEHCPVAASETVSIDPLPTPTKILSIVLDRGLSDSEKILLSKETEKDQSDIIYIVFYFKKERSKKSGDAIRKSFADQITRSCFHGTRVTFADGLSETESVEVWKVPPGALPPSPEPGR